jgi:TetR/AcrR family transcriptional regulator
MPAKPAATAPRPRGRPGKSRPALLEAAIKEFAEKGFAGATTADIARRAKTQQPLVHHHFGSKDELFKVVLDTLFDELRRDILPAPGEQVGLSGLVRRFVLFTARRPELARIWVIESAYRGPHLKYMLDHHVLPLMRIATPLIAQDMRADLDPTLLVYAIQGLVTYPFLVPQQVKGATGADARAPAFAETYADVVAALLAPSMRNERS